MARLTREELAAFVAQSCDRQGVPVKVTDARVVENVATLLLGGRVPKSHSRRVEVEVDVTGEEIGRLEETGS